MSYLAPNYDPLIASGQMTLMDLDGAGGFTQDDARLRGAEALPPVPIRRRGDCAGGLGGEFSGAYGEHAGRCIWSRVGRACVLYRAT